MLITDKNELKRFEARHRVWQGIPSIVRTKKGRTFITFFSGNTNEAFGNFCAVIMSDGDTNFSEPIAVTEKSGKNRCFDSVLWIDPLDRLWFIWNVMPEECVYGVICENPDAKELVWGEEFLIGYGVMKNKPLVLSTGEWLFPIARWKPYLAAHLRDKEVHKELPYASYVYKTSDNGKTFSILGKSDIRDRDYDEHMIYEMNNGLLRMLVRLNNGIGECFSYDRGQNWSQGQKSDIAGPCSRFFIQKLRSGRVLLINHFNFTGRNNLTALLSEDDGKTFPYTLLLDERYVSYPDAIECDDGYIYIVYDRERGAAKKKLEEVYASAREILTAKITEEDIIKGQLVSEKSFLKNVVNKLGELDEADGDPFAEPPISDSDFAESLIDSKVNYPINAVFERYPIDCSSTSKFDFVNLDKMINRFLEDGSTSKELLREIIGFIRSCPAKEKEEIPIIEKAREFIDTHSNEDFTVSEFSEHMKISVHYLFHLFKHVTGTSIIAYRNSLRLTNAKRLLINTTKSISEIAQEVGFCSAAYFTEMFTRSETISPSEFRKLHQKT